MTPPYTADGFKPELPQAIKGEPILVSISQSTYDFSSTTIHLISGHAIDRARTARRILAMGLHAEIFENAKEFLNHAPKKGIVLIYEEDDGGAIDLINRMNEANFCLPVIACFNNFDCDSIVSSIKGGVFDCLIEPFSDENFLKKIGKANADTELIMTAYRRKLHSAKLLARLTSREIEVLDFLVNGFTSKQIARSFNISPRTIEIHRKHLQEKFEVNSTAEVIRIFLESREFQ